MTDFSYGTGWFAGAVISHDAVLGASALANGHVTVEREDLAPITVAPVIADRIDASVVESVLTGGVPTVILAVKKASHYDWDARELAEANDSTVHTFKELYTFMRDADPRPGLDKNVHYVRDRLEQHSKVAAVEMICEASMHIRRRGPLSDVIAAVEYQYEFSEEALVSALKHHPEAGVIINANPNGKPTKAALAHAESTEVPIVSTTEMMRAFNFNGPQIGRSMRPNR